MKYKIGQRMFESYLCIDGDEISEQEDTCEIICIALFGDGTWKYGVREDMAEYSCMVDFHSEEELEGKYTIKEIVQ